MGADVDAETAYVNADKGYIAAAKKSAKCSEARGALPAGSTRARVTTANARWMRAAEERDRVEKELRLAWRLKAAVEKRTDEIRELE